MTDLRQRSKRLCMTKIPLSWHIKLFLNQKNFENVNINWQKRIFENVNIYCLLFSDVDLFLSGLLKVTLAVWTGLAKQWIPNIFSNNLSDP